MSSLLSRRQTVPPFSSSFIHMVSATVWQAPLNHADLEYTDLYRHVAFITYNGMQSLWMARLLWKASCSIETTRGFCIQVISDVNYHLTKEGKKLIMTATLVEISSSCSWQDRQWRRKDEMIARVRQRKQLDACNRSTGTASSKLTYQRLIHEVVNSFNHPLQLFGVVIMCQRLCRISASTSVYPMSQNGVAICKKREKQ